MLCVLTRTIIYVLDVYTIRKWSCAVHSRIFSFLLRISNQTQHQIEIQLPFPCSDSLSLSLYRSIRSETTAARPFEFYFINFEGFYTLMAFITESQPIHTFIFFFGQCTAYNWLSFSVSCKLISVCGLYFVVLFSISNGKGNVTFGFIQNTFSFRNFFWSPNWIKDFSFWFGFCIWNDISANFICWPSPTIDPCMCVCVCVYLYISFDGTFFCPQFPLMHPNCSLSLYISLFFSFFVFAS